MRYWAGYAVVGGSAAVVGLLFVLMNLHYNWGTFSAPLDDTFIHLQYGRQIGGGEWFRYNDGEPVSTGASSLLYAFILGAASFLGLDGNYLLGFAILFGTALLVVAAVLGYALARALAGERAGVWGGLLVATNGAFAWGATSGMEIALLSVLLLGTLLAFLRELPARRFVLTPLLATLAALTRPEGLIFATVITGAVLLELWASSRKRNLPASRAARPMLYALLPVFAGVGQLLFYRVATGTTAASGVQAKGLLYRPAFYPTEFVDSVFRNLTDIIFKVFSGLGPSNYLFPGTIFFCALGVSYLLFREEPRWKFAVVAGGALALALLSIATLGSWRWQHYRYLLPFFPVLLVFMVVGFRSIAAASRSSWLLHALAGFALLFSLLGLPIWAATTGGASLQVREQQTSIAYWIKENLPQDARVAINDAGALRYYSDRETVDLIGLTTEGLALPNRHGTGSLYEALERMPEKERPDYFTIYKDWFEGLEDSEVFGRRVARFYLSERPGTARIVGGREVVIYKADWDKARSGESFPGTGEKDSLDVADLYSEEAHDYEMELPLIGLEPENVITEDYDPAYGSSVVDAGREIPGAEAFTARNLSANRPLKIVMRTTNDPFELRVRANGEDVGTWVFEEDYGYGWQETSFTVPARFVRSDTLRLELLPPEDEPLQTHTAYHYWFVQ